jgi:hypothetical protein
MRIRLVLRGVLALVMIVGLATSASAQSSLATDRLLYGVSFNIDSATATTLSTPVAFRMAAPAPATMQGGSASWRPMVLGGLNTGFGGGAGFGFAVGGGVQASNFIGREEFGLQIDGLFSNVGGCAGCDEIGDFSATQIAISGAFLYKFKEMTSGWQPFAGGGLVFTRFSFSFDDFDDACDFPGVDCSVTSVGVQIQGGLAKGNLHIEGRVQGTAGGAFLALVGYKFGGG